MLKVTREWNTKAMCEICSNITITDPEQRQRRNSGVFVTLADFTHSSVVSIVDFEQVNVSWV